MRRLWSILSAALAEHPDLDDVDGREESSSSSSSSGHRSPDVPAPEQLQRGDEERSPDCEPTSNEKHGRPKLEQAVLHDIVKLRASVTILTSFVHGGLVCLSQPAPRPQPLLKPILPLPPPPAPSSPSPPPTSTTSLPAPQPSQQPPSTSMLPSLSTEVHVNDNSSTVLPEQSSHPRDFDGKNTDHVTSEANCHHHHQQQEQLQSDILDFADPSANRHLETWMVSQPPSALTMRMDDVEDVPSTCRDHQQHTAQGALDQPVNHDVPSHELLNSDLDMSFVESWDVKQSRRVLENSSAEYQRVEHDHRTFDDHAISDQRVDTSPVEILVSALQELAYVMVRNDKAGSPVWDFFMEAQVMRLLAGALQRTANNEQLGISKNTVGEQETHSKVMSSNTGPLSGIKDPAINTPNDVSGPFVDGAETEPSSARSAATLIQTQVLRTLSILVQSLTRRESLFCIFAADHINKILSFDFEFDNEELLLYFMSAAKTIAMKLDDDLVQFFFDTRCGLFPLYTNTTRFYAHPEGMVRIAVRNLTLSIYALSSPEVRAFTVRDPTAYFTHAVDRLARMCGEVARAFEFLLDDGREISRSVSRRVERFRQKVRMTVLVAEISEIENVMEYLNEVTAAADPELSSVVVELVTTRLFAPFFLPIASQASPVAVGLAAPHWTFRQSRSSDTRSAKRALHVLDAGARCLLLGYLVTLVNSPRLTVGLMNIVVHPSSRFEHRSVLHGLKVMASNLESVERVTHIALCALQAFIRWQGMGTNSLKELGLTFDVSDSDSEEDVTVVDKLPEESSLTLPTIRSLENELDDNATASVHLRMRKADSCRSPQHILPDEGALTPNGSSEALVMNLAEFKAPLTALSPANVLTPSTDNLGSSRDDLSDVLDLASPSTSIDDTVSVPDSPKSGSPVPLPTTANSTENKSLGAFRRGDASMREVLCSVLLVVRRREVRTVRVCQAISRIIFDVGLRTGDWLMSLDVAKNALDEMATAMLDFLGNSRTTIVAIESAFENFSAASAPEWTAGRSVPQLLSIFRVDELPRLAADLPPGSGRRRRRRSGVRGSSEPPWPVEREDAHAYFVMLHAYERILEQMMTASRVGSLLGDDSDGLKKRRSLCETVLSVVQDEESGGSYVEMKEALGKIARSTLAHSFRSYLTRDRHASSPT